MTKHEYPKESMKTQIKKEMNYLNNWIGKYNKNPPKYLATPAMLKRFNQMFTKTTSVLHKMTNDPEQKWLGYYHGAYLEHEPYHDFKIESHKSIQYWVKLYMPINPQTDNRKYETFYLGLVANKQGQIIDFKTDIFIPRILKGIKGVSD